jgi:DNA-binding LacI/PurR family transcriptional regulator
MRSNIAMNTSSSPKYQTLAQLFAQRIRSGELQPGDRLPSFTQMRAQYGATPATVERLYSQLEREKLIERRHRSGVFVADAQSARMLTGTIGFVALHFSNRLLHPYNHHLLQGIQQEVRQAGVQIMLLDACDIAANREKIDGLLIYEHGHTDEATYQQQGLPCVSLVLQKKGIPSVVADDFDGGYCATQHLLELGHERIACLMGSDLLDTRDTLGELRIAGYRAALERAGVTGDSRWVRPVPYNPLETYAERGYSAMTQWLREGWSNLGCTAILTQNDDVAIGVINALQDNGYSVPGDISAIGFDGAGVDAHYPLKLTTVEVPLEVIGAQGARLLLRMIEGEDNSSHQVLPAPLRVGQTSAAPQHAAKPVTIEHN